MMIIHSRRLSFRIDNANDNHTVTFYERSARFLIAIAGLSLLAGMAFGPGFLLFATTMWYGR